MFAPFSYTERGFSQDDLPLQRRGLQHDDLPPQRRGYQQDDPLPQRRGFQHDDLPPQRRGLQHDDLPPQRRGLQHDDLPPQRRGFQHDDITPQRRSFKHDDITPQRRSFKHDDLRGASPQRNNMSRPNGRSIYMQRREYSEALNKQPDNFHVRVEHLLTCELDGQDLKTANDCVAKLKRLDTKGRLWAQEMIMETQSGLLLLCDIETKEELESMPLSHIQQTKSVLDSCAYNSLLILTVKERSKRFPNVFMFQCEETGAEVLKSDLDEIIRKGGGDVEPVRHHSDIRSNLENIIGQHNSGGFRPLGPRAVLRERSPSPPPIQPAPQWGHREQENMPPPRFYAPQDEVAPHPDLHELQGSPSLSIPSSPDQKEMERNTDILNHILTDMETFMGKVAAAANAPPPQVKKSKKKKIFKMKKSKKNAVRLPDQEEYFSCLQKIKYGFNLLGLLDGTLANPSAVEFVHIFFTSLGRIVPQYDEELPANVISPLLTEAALQLLNQVVTPEEDQLWRSLGECWNVPRSSWHDDVPPYVLEFDDGWQPPPPVHRPSPLPYQNSPISRSNSQRFPSGQPNGQMNDSLDNFPRYDEPVNNPPLPERSNEPPEYMRVIYNFVARNNRELSLLTGEVVEVVQKNKQWWLVRNARGEEGNIPQNVLEPMMSDGPMDDRRQTHSQKTLDMSSSPAEVRAWLDYKGFSKMTVRSLGVLNGTLLLGMSKEEMRTVCPEEGGKVFFQLQAIRAAVSLASETSGPYNSRY